MVCVKMSHLSFLLDTQNKEDNKKQHNNAMRKVSQDSKDLEIRKK